MRIAFTIALASALLCAAPMEAQKESKRREPPKTKKVETISRRIYEALQGVQKAMEEENWASAETKLNAILARKKLNDHEKAQVHQTFGYLYSSKENYKQAIRSFRKAIELNGLPEAAQLNTQFNLGQLYMLTGQYQRGIQTLLDWFKKVEDPAPNAYMLLANAYAQKEDYRTAWKWAKQGLDRMVEPREPWMRLGAQLNLALENYRSARYWLERLVEDWPRESYLKQITAVYSQLGQPRRALVATELAQREGYLNESKELVHLAQLYLFNEVPYKAGKLMESAIQREQVENNKDNYELLANAFTMSRDYDRALSPLGKAASLAKDGKLYIRLGQIHMDAERWAQAEKAIERGIKRGKIKSTGEAYLLLGITQFQRDRFDDARRSFERCANFKKSRKSCLSWQRTLEVRSQFL